MQTTSITEDLDAPVNTTQLRRAWRERILTWIMPITVLIIAFGLWEYLVWHHEIPKYLIPAPSLIAETLIKLSLIHI